MCALTSVRHLRIPAPSVCLSVGSLYYQRAAHMPAGLQLGPTQFCCSACFLITSVFIAASCVVVPNDQSFCSIFYEHSVNHLDLCSCSLNMKSVTIVHSQIDVQGCWSLLNGTWKQGSSRRKCLRVFYFQSEALKTEYSLKKNYYVLLTYKESGNQKVCVLWSDCNPVR